MFRLFLLTMFFSFSMPFCWAQQPDRLIIHYNQCFEQRDFVGALSICETLIASAPDNIDFHREKAKLLAATNQREKFIQEMLLIRNFNNPKNGEAFFCALSHNLVTKALRDDLRRVFYKVNDTPILLSWPKFADEAVVDCATISDDLEKYSAKNNSSMKNTSEQSSNSVLSQTLPTANNSVDESYVKVDIDDLRVDFAASDGKRVKLHGIGSLFDVNQFYLARDGQDLNYITIDTSNISRDQKKYIIQNFQAQSQVEITVYGTVWARNKYGWKVICDKLEW